MQPARHLSSTTVSIWCEKSGRMVCISVRVTCRCAKRAKALGAHTLRIYTSRQLIPANKLYVSEGFTEVAMSYAQRQRYKRADIMYDYPLL